MNVLHLLTGGDTGGIEILCKDYQKYSINNNFFLFLWGNGIIVDEMKHSGANVIELGASKKQIIKTVKVLNHICHNNHIEIIIVHHAAPLSHIYSRFLKILNPKIRVYAYAHGAAEDMCRYHDGNGLWMRKKVLSYSLNRADKVIAISEFVKSSLVNYFGIPEKKIDVIYNGVDLNRFKTQNHKHSKKLRMIYVGRLIEEKGVQNIIRVVASLHRDLECSLIIVGDGKYKKSLINLSNELNLNEIVTFLGNRRDVPELLASSTIFLHFPEWEEGFGITILEAMASGLICVCTKKGAIPEIIEDGKSGFLVDGNNDAIKVLKHINNLNYEERLQISNNAIDRSRQFSINQFSEKLDAKVQE